MRAQFLRAYDRRWIDLGFRMVNYTTNRADVKHPQAILAMFR